MHWQPLKTAHTAKGESQGTLPRVWARAAWGALEPAALPWLAAALEGKVVQVLKRVGPLWQPHQHGAECTK